MATTSNTITATAGQTEFSFSFPYLKKESIRVTIDTVATTAFTIPDNNPTTVVLNSGATAGQVIKIFRLTSTDATSATFFSGGAIRAEDLNNNFDSILYITQERENQTDEIIQGGIVDGSITSSKLANHSVGTAALIDGGVATVDLADNAVTTAKIADANVTTAKILDANVTTAKILDANVTTAKIADDAVTAAKVAPGLLLPTGAITAFGGSTAPTGYLECNGQSTSGYTALAAVVGANVPDLRGEFVRGWDHGRGVDSGRGIRSTQDDTFKSHNHDFRAPTGDRDDELSQGWTGTANNVASFRTSDRAGELRTYNAIENEGGNETRPRNIALMYIIKT